MSRDFRRIAIVNRGEAAMRFIHAAREFSEEHGVPFCTVALYTDPDRHAMFVREADEAVYLGPPHTCDPETGQARSTYVDYKRLEEALSAARADAVWVGWGFVAEHARFADLCADLGLVFIGPSGDVMRMLGDKIRSKQLAEQAHIPVTPWSCGAADTLEVALHHAERIGYPLFIKASAGGGGRGIRRVDRKADLERAFHSARAEAFKAFGDPTVFLEQVVVNARHIEVQVIADSHGTVWAAGVRDCTIQRRQQKILEEGPAAILSPAEDREVREAAIRLSRRVGYQNAGTVEFLFHPADRQFAFMEMNTRLQVEHPVTECTTGLDLVKLQIHVARGGRLEGEPPRPAGHAIEVRLNAEDPDNGFAAAPGLLERFRIGTGPGIRVDTGVAEGDTIPSDFDSMIAKIIAFGGDRSEALVRLRRVLQHTEVVVRGGASNKSFLLDLVARPEVRTNRVHTGWMDELSAAGGLTTRDHAPIAVLQAAIERYCGEFAIELEQFLLSASRGRPQVRSEAGRSVDLRYRGTEYSARVHRVGPERYRVHIDENSIDVVVERLGSFEYWVTVAGRRYHVVSLAEPTSHRIEVNGVAHRVDCDAGGIVRSPAPAVVVSVAVEPGQSVTAGQPVAILEAMKMEIVVKAPCSGTVRQVLTNPHVQVASGARLLRIEPAAAGDRAGDSERLDFAAIVEAASATNPDAACLDSLEELRQITLGFDVQVTQAASLAARGMDVCAFPVDENEIFRREDEILGIFVDVCALFQRNADADGGSASEARSPESWLFAYLRTFETRDLPEWFAEAIRRALAHYGIRILEQSPQLKEALLWICKSHAHVEQQTGPITAVLQRRLERSDRLAGSAPESLRLLLDRMVSVTRGIDQSLSDLARELAYRLFDQPILERARRQIYEQVNDHLVALQDNPSGPDRRDRVRALIECAQPLEELFSDRFQAASPAMRQLMLEVITARYYRVRTLVNFTSTSLGDSADAAQAEYDFEGKRIHVFAIYSERTRLYENTCALVPLLSTVPLDHDVVIDCYVSQPDWVGDGERLQRELQEIVNRIDFGRPIRRVVAAVAGAQAQEHFTWRPAGEGFKEDKLYRGLHPMMGKRLHLWRFQNFNLERLPSVNDIYLFHATARENPKDERLLACAEVRDLTPVRDSAGRVVQLPYLERKFTEAVAAIRAFQARRQPKDRLYWNRILLYVWPPMICNEQEFQDIVRKLLPVTEGLGLEQVVVRVRILNPETGEYPDMVIRISSQGGSNLLMTFRPAAELVPLKPLAEYERKVLRMRQRGLIYPYEIVRMLTPSPENTRAGFPPGDFLEHDLDADGELVPVGRPYGQNSSNIIVGLICNFTEKYPDGMTRVMVLGDPGKDLAALAESECRRLVAAIDLARRLNVPLEWFAISAGAKISMDSGVENMDWIALVLRRIVEFTQAGGEINIILDGINVGAQSYWNGESTMLMHTRGILVMTPRASMVLTGKRALDYSGSVSAEDNQGIGGYERIMGPNGQAQYRARDIDEACQILLRHYEHTYIAPGERFPRSVVTNDPVDRDVCLFPHGNDDGFALIGEVLSDATNPGRKKPFDVRRVMQSVIDQDHPPLERWAGMLHAETAVVWDAHLGGNPVCLIGIESRPLRRTGFVPADGPDQWTAGTLFPLSSKKVARAINAASKNRPVVILANLSGFDGSPESMRKLQLEYGSEIGRAVVNFSGPMVFCVISRYHGGAYVVFSRALNDGLEVAALDGAYASVIGGAPAAAVVFAGEVEARTRKEPRISALREAMEAAEGAERSRLRTEMNNLFKVVYSEKLGEVGDEFDRIHSVQRALKVGALHRIVAPGHLRPYLIDAVRRGMARESGTGTARAVLIGAD